MKKEVFLILLFFILFVNYVHAIGISPPLIEVNPEPNLKKDFTATVLSTSSKDIYVNIFTKGTLKDYIKLKENKVKVPKLGGADIHFSLELPNKLNLEPGKQYGYVMVEEGSSTSGGSFQVMTSVGLTILAFIPYPGKYLEITDFKVPNVKENEILPIEIKAVSRGNEIINQIDATIEIYKGDLRLETLYLDKVTNLKSGDTAYFSTEFNTKSYKPGVYNTKLILRYDGNKLETERSFEIGTLLVEITNYTRKHYKDDISRFIVSAKSHWNDPLDNVYAEVIINDTKFKSSPDRINPFEESGFLIYLDTHNFDVGYYNANMTIFYANRSTSLISGIEIIKKPFNLGDSLKGKTTQILVIVIIILLILNLLWLIKKKKDE
ncbi:MAG: hypothetical protein NT139_02480 [Candidatus Woesearchaeota archaeon]|nr:hypothetical protein [Candidatus Woesearchaeota archaeon]